MHPSDPGYWKPKPPPLDWPEHDPIPEVLSTDPRPEGAPAEPLAVIKLQRVAEAAGWTTRVGYSRAPIRAQKVGTYKMAESFGVWAAPHAATGWRFRAVYQRTTGSWSWSIGLWQAGRPRFLHATITDLYEWLAVDGDVGKPWFKAIEAREVEKKERQRAAARNRTARPKEGAS